MLVYDKHFIRNSIRYFIDMYFSVVNVSKISAASYVQTTPFLQCLALHCLPITVQPVARKFGTIPHSFVNESTSDVIDETKKAQKKPNLE